MRKFLRGLYCTFRGGESTSVSYKVFRPTFFFRNSYTAASLRNSRTIYTTVVYSTSGVQLYGTLHHVIYASKRQK